MEQRMEKREGEVNQLLWGEEGEKENCGRKEMCT